MKLSFEFELNISPNNKAAAAKDHGKNHIFSVYHLLHDGLLTNAIPSTQVNTPEE